MLLISIYYIITSSAHKVMNMNDPEFHRLKEKIQRFRVDRTCLSSRKSPLSNKDISMNDRKRYEIPGHVDLFANLCSIARQNVLR
jgi:hypothetical protein